MKNFIEKEKFKPSFFSILYHPFFFVRREIYYFLEMHSNFLNGKLLDFGCGSKPYEKLFKNSNNYVGVEVSGNKENLKSDIYYDGITLPFADNTFDSILCTEVFEHVEQLDDVIIELYRVLKPGGRMIVTTPFMCIEHEMPYDFRRFTFNGLINLMKKNNFKILKSKKLLNNFHVFFQTLNFYICQVVLKKKNQYLIYLVYFGLVGPVNFLSLLFNFFLPKANEMYFGSGVVVEK
jgi:SAM-dependent methyltransferase